MGGVVLKLLYYKLEVSVMGYSQKCSAKNAC